MITAEEAKKNARKVKNIEEVSAPILEKISEMITETSNAGKFVLDYNGDSNEYVVEQLIENGFKILPSHSCTLKITWK